MMDEHGFDLDYSPQERKPLVAVFPHPIHGRLVERVVMMVSHSFRFLGQLYSFSWRDGDVVFYQPA